MKKSIIYFGIALVSLSNVYSASNNLSNEKKLSVVKENTDTKRFPAIVDETILNPETIIPMNSGNTIENIIAENNSIIENKAITNPDLFYIEKSIEDIILADNQLIESEINNLSEPIYIEKSIEEVIKADNQIIESKISNEAYPLDFEKINSKTNPLKQLKSKNFVGMN